MEILSIGVIQGLYSLIPYRQVNLKIKTKGRGSTVVCVRMWRDQSSLGKGFGSLG